MTTIYPGATPAISFRFTRNGVLADPASLTVTVRSPAGVETTYIYLSDANLTKTSVGVFQLVFLVPKLRNSVGLWRYREDITGYAYLPVERSFRVERSPFDMFDS